MKKYKFTLELTKEELKHYDSEDAKEWTCRRLFNKDDIVKVLDDEINEQTELYEELIAQGKTMEAKLHTIKKNMYEELKRNVIQREIFPFPKTGAWSYAISIKNDETLKVEAWHEYGVVEWEGFNDLIPEDPDSIYIVDEIKPKYISTKEYAKLYNVEPVTVRQWIRRGKLRKVKFVNGAWAISELAIPSEDKGYKNITYKNINDNFVVNDEYKLIEDFDELSITQNENDKKKFIIKIVYKDCSYKEKEVDSILKEKIEHLLICSDSIETQC